MKQLMFSGLLVAIFGTVKAQELFVFTEPASNMATGSIGLRLNNYLMKEQYQTGTNYHFIPEIMVGASKKLMVHADGFFSNRNKQGLELEGAGLYAKYRFFSNDDIQKHFRMAAYVRLGLNNSSIHQEEIETYGHNSGYELGIVATQLLHRLAVSSSVSYEKAMDNGGGHKYPYTGRSAAVNYTFSAGKLVLPKAYTSYNQVNLNLMVEVLGQTNTGNGRSFLDIAPSLQVIINSRSRIDLGYRQQLYSSLFRTAPNGFIVRLEHNLFNVF
ncbi:MAG: hypothetical protein ABIX01_07050 [Chitinophagaceae bacterium]